MNPLNAAHTLQTRRPEEPNAPIRILIADDHALFRRGLVEILAAQQGMIIVGEAEDLESLFAQITGSMPDLVILDLRMSGKDAVSAIPNLLAALPGVMVLVLTVSDAPADLYRSFLAGVSGYLLKDVNPDDLVLAIRDLFRGEVPLSPSLVRPYLRLVRGTRKTGGQAHPAEDPPLLARRELEVLGLIAAGKSNKTIAETLGISEFTVKNHVKSILMKLNVSNRTQAVSYAIQSGLLLR